MGEFEGEGEAPLAPAATEWRPQAVPVATKEATGIDSRDEGFPFPLNPNHKPETHKHKKPLALGAARGF